MNIYRERIQALRTLLQKENITAFLVPQEDEFLSLLLSPCDRRLEWLCGFGGTTGLLIVTQTQAVFFTDTRYATQAQETMDPDLFEVLNTAQMPWLMWLKTHLDSGDRLAYDPWLYRAQTVSRIENTLQPLGVDLVPLPQNPIDQLWTNRPAPAYGKLFLYDASLAGESSDSKRSRIAQSLPPDALLVIAGGDSLCWLLNVRGQDSDYVPTFQGYGVLESSGYVHLLIDPRKITPEVEAALKDSVSFWPLEDFTSRLSGFAQGKTVLFDPVEIPEAVRSIVQAAEPTRIIQGPNPCLLPKAIKNTQELKQIQEGHVWDGVALVRLFHWLQTHPCLSDVSEWDVVEKLWSFKKHNPFYSGDSFPTISGFGPNGALIHYRPKPDSRNPLGSGTFFLLDSGSQYRTGATTDVTRTLALGDVSDLQKSWYTRVLQGHIALSRVVFPKGTRGCQLDTLARTPLWEVGEDYGHSTGHGVGAFLKVHEGPCGISQRDDGLPLQAGMVITIEPGYYLQGQFGIRLENMTQIVEHPQGHGREFSLGFEPLTLAPFDPKAILPELLTEPEVSWLNAYHARVYDTLAPHLDEEVNRWLKTQTLPIKRHP